MFFLAAAADSLVIYVNEKTVSLNSFGKELWHHYSRDCAVITARVTVITVRATVNSIWVASFFAQAP